MVREATLQKCSKCNREIRWGTKQDERMHAKTGMCFDCLIEEETTMRIKGKYKPYEKKKMLNNELSYLLEIKEYLTDSKRYLKEHNVFTYVNSNGLVEEWDNVARDDVLKNIKKDYTRCLKEIRRVKAELKMVEGELVAPAAL
jgi:hypothetical protein